MAMLGRRAWGLPRWIDRITPDVDIEGAKLPGRDASEEEQKPQPLAVR
jgi:RND superfamily putative drug exporter